MSEEPEEIGPTEAEVLVVAEFIGKTVAAFVHTTNQMRGEKIDRVSLLVDALGQAAWGAAVAVMGMPHNLEEATDSVGAALGAGLQFAVENVTVEEAEEDGKLRRVISMGDDNNINDRSVH